MSVFAKIKSLFRSGPARVDVEKRFQTYARLGQGSMSKVFRARDFMSGRTVALKILDIEKTAKLMARDFGGAKRPSEGEVAVTLKHPSVVVTYEFGMTTKNEMYLVMEFIEGVGFNFLIETKAPALQGKRIKYLIQTAEGLAYIHEQGYIHRDICPRNVMISQEGEAKLIDFGLAVPNKPEFRRPGNRTGTANYMAPELIKRMPTDEKIDIYSFGIMAYETIVGRYPWEAADTMQMMREHMNTPPKDPRELREDVEEDLAKLLLRTMAVSPKMRLASMREFAAALKGLNRQDY
jgi:serine/threonine protein kinase